MGVRLAPNLKDYPRGALDGQAVSFVLTQSNPGKFEAQDVTVGGDGNPAPPGGYSPANGGSKGGGKQHFSSPYGQGGGEKGGGKGKAPMSGAHTSVASNSA